MGGMSYPIVKPLITFWWIGFILIALLFLSGCESIYKGIFPENHGEIKVILNTKPDYLKWELKINKLDMITAANIHCQPNGYVGISLNAIVFNLNGKTEEIKTSGTAVTPDKGNFCGWLTMKDVESSIKAGNAYVNVHTYAQPKGAVQATIKSPPIIESLFMCRLDLDFFRKRDTQGQ